MEQAITLPSGSIQSLRARRLIPLLFVLAGAISMRAAANFSAAIPPGIDAAYYPLQARSLIEQGKLAYTDLPLIFVLDAALAKVFMLASGMAIDPATLLASRIVDSVTEPFAALPIFALGFAWSRTRERRWGVIFGVTGAAMLATLSLPMLRMTGDFEKNSLGLVWLALAAWSAHHALARPGWARWAVLALAVSLSAITHVAAFGATVVLVGTTLITFILLRRNADPRRLLGIAGGVLASGALMLLMVYLASPRRAAALLAAPLKLFQRTAGPGGGPGGPGGPPLDAMSLAIFILTYSVVGLAVWRLWRLRNKLPHAQSAVVVGASVAAMLLACPLISGEYSMRLVLMAPVPAAIVLVFLVCTPGIEGRRPWPALAAGALSLASVAAGFGWLPLPAPAHPRGGGPPLAQNSPGADPRANVRPGRPPGPPGGGAVRGVMTKVISDDSAAELRSMQPLVTDRARTVVLAQKGVMWWAGFYLHSPVREDRTDADSLKKYNRVLVLQQKRSLGPGPRMNEQFPPDAPDHSDQARRERRGPPEPVPLPAGSTLIHEGEHFRLYEVRNGEPVS